MGRKSDYDKLAEAISARLHQMRPENCTSVEQAEGYEALLVDQNLASPSQPGSYDMCPTHDVVRFRGQCHLCD